MWWFKVGSKPQRSYSHQQVSAPLSSAVRGDVRSLCTAPIALVFLLVVSSIASAFVRSTRSTDRNTVVESRMGARATRSPAGENASVSPQTGFVGCWWQPQNSVYLHKGLLREQLLLVWWKGNAECVMPQRHAFCCIWPAYCCKLLSIVSIWS